jgi:hypothetical protein
MKFSKGVVGSLHALSLVGALVSGTVAAAAVGEKDHLAQRDREDFSFWRGLQEDVTSLPPAPTGKLCANQL